MTDTALIFEGGGMRAALTSAMVIRLLEEEIYFDWVAGISAGATNTANYLSHDPWRARRCADPDHQENRPGSWKENKEGSKVKRMYL